MRVGSCRHLFPRLPVLAALLTLASLSGCGPSEELASDLQTLSTLRSALQSDNGLVTNGLVTNGLVTNGLVTNGLVTNGLVTNGLNTTAFATWFQANPASFSDMVMRYVVACGKPAGQSLSWTDPATQVAYTWNGALGLTPGWSSGNPATEVEEQLITACLGAVTNRYGVHVELSINGENALGARIATAPGELAQFSIREACFAGNLFTGVGVYSANDRNLLTSSQSTSRGCGLTAQADGTSTECAPMVHVGMCDDFCSLDSTRTYYRSCSWNGKQYKPLTTRIQPSDVFTCGDGVCQFTEKCGSTSKTKTPDDCGVDCGVCSH